MYSPAFPRLNDSMFGKKASSSIDDEEEYQFTMTESKKINESESDESSDEESETSEKSASNQIGNGFISMTKSRIDIDKKIVNLEQFRNYMYFEVYL